MIDTVQEVLAEGDRAILIKGTWRIFSLFEMIENYAAMFVVISQLFDGSLDDVLVSDGARHPSVERIFVGVGKLKYLTELGCKTSAIYAERISEAYQKDPASVARNGMLKIFRERLKDELESVWFKHVANPELYNVQHPFGVDVANRFPSAITDIQEAGKCLALERYTASVFHLMRALDASLRDLAATLGLTLPADRDWQHYLSAINNAVAGLPTSNEPERNRKSALAETANHLYNVKLSWRNGVMHPRDSYSTEEAKEVYEAVKAFMRHLSTVL